MMIVQLDAGFVYDFPRPGDVFPWPPVFFSGWVAGWANQNASVFGHSFHAVLGDRGFPADGLASSQALLILTKTKVLL
jgi:hypothetical protein